MNTSFSLSADGYEEHNMDGADPQDFKEVTELWLRFLRLWIMGIFTSEFYRWKTRRASLTASSLGLFLRVSWAVLRAPQRWGVSWWSSAALRSSWNTLTDFDGWGSVRLSTGSGAFWVNMRQSHVIIRHKSWGSLWAGPRVIKQGLGLWWNLSIN